MLNAIQLSGRYRVAGPRFTVRRYGSTTSRTGFRGRSVLPPREQLTVISDDGTKTFRLRQHGNTSLPLPPIMDPIVIEARERHKRPKQYPDRDDLTAFQTQLAANPHAHALSGAIRKCAYTGARLPSHFLLPFRAQFSPSSTLEGRIEASIVHKGMSSDQAGYLQDGAAASPSSSYVLNSLALLRILNVRNGWTTLITERMKKAFDARAAGRKADSSRKWAKQWTHDTNLPETVLDSLRKDVVIAFQELANATDNSRYFKLLGGSDEGEDVPGHTTSATTGLRGPQASIHDLRRLLTAENWQLLHSNDDLAHSEVGNVSIIAKAQTVKLRLSLERLSMFLSNGSIGTSAQ